MFLIIYNFIVTTISATHLRQSRKPATGALMNGRFLRALMLVLWKRKIDFSILLHFYLRSQRLPGQALLGEKNNSYLYTLS